METIKGKAVTDEQIQAWADEAEHGYDLAELKKRGRPTLGNSASSVIPVRMDDELIKALLQKAEKEHLNRSEAIRTAVEAWIAA